MNANEITVLIGLLQSKAQTTGKINAFIKQSAATMLRQQQAEIEALKAELNKWMNGDYVMSAGEQEK